MPELFVANCTKQDHYFVYRVLNDKKRTKVQRISIGGQVKVYTDMPVEDIDYIVSQHAAYGLIRAEEVTRATKFVGLCYSIGKPVDLEKIMVAEEHNAEVMQEAALQVRRETAVAINNAIEGEGAVVNRL